MPLKTQKQRDVVEPTSVAEGPSPCVAAARVHTTPQPTGPPWFLLQEEAEPQKGPQLGIHPQDSGTLCWP